MHGGPTRNFLVSFYPLCSTEHGRKAASMGSLLPFIDRLFPA